MHCGEVMKALNESLKHCSSVNYRVTAQKPQTGKLATAFIVLPQLSVALRAAAAAELVMTFCPSGASADLSASQPLNRTANTLDISISDNSVVKSVAAVV